MDLTQLGRKSGDVKRDILFISRETKSAISNREIAEGYDVISVQHNIKAADEITLHPFCAIAFCI